MSEQHTEWFDGKVVQGASLATKPEHDYRGVDGDAGDLYVPGTTGWSSLGSPVKHVRCLFVYPGMTSPGWGSLRPGATSNEAVYMSHGMSYVSAALKARGHMAWLLDMRECRGWADFARRVKAEDYDVAYIGFLSLDIFAAACAVRVLKETHPDRPVIVGGLHVTCAEEKVYPGDLPRWYKPAEMHPLLREFLAWKGETDWDQAKWPDADCVIWNEAEIAACLVAERIAEGKSFPKFINAKTIPDLSHAPHADRDLFNLDAEANAPLLPYLPKPFFTITFGRGCPFKCLAGDTPVNTVYGDIPIRELAENYDEIPVFTRDPKTGRAFVTAARNIGKYGENESLVRVNFDDGTHIDCTPDHRFVAFSWGNQFCGEREWEVEAKELATGMHVRAIRDEISGPEGDKYVSMAWTRRGRAKKHRMVMEWMLGRALTDGEEVHHVDGDKMNNLPENLELCSSRKDHVDRHPEIAQRMRDDNPAKNGLSREWKEKISASTRGVPKSQETRDRMRVAAARRWADPEYRKACVDGMNHRQVVNHRVVSVETLPGLHDVYCLEVPAAGWFYANSVLVKNCSFCLSGDTLVDTVGGKVRIDLLVKSGVSSIKVYTHDKTTRKIVPAMATDIRVTRTGQTLLRVTFNDGGYIDCTSDHRFMVDTGRKFSAVEASELLAVDEQLVAMEGERESAKEIRRSVKSIHELPGTHDVYCLTVPDHGWFFANGVLVSNCNVGEQLSSADVRLIDVDYFMDELEQLKARYGRIGSLMIHDDILLYPKWLEKWNLELRRRFGYTPYWCQMRADFIVKKPDLIKLMAECGMGWVSIGIESFSQRLLDFMSKGTTVEQNVKAMEICRDLGVNVFCNWMLGIPTETPEDVKATADWLTKLRPGFHSASIYCDYPGTALWRYITENNLRLPRHYTRTHYPWQWAIKGVDYDLALSTRARITSQFPNKPVRPKFWSVIE